VSLATVLILLTVLVVSVALLLVVVAAVWWIDRYDREPLHLVAFVFLWGASIAPLASVAAVGALARIFGGSFIGVGFDPIGSLFFGPVIEEIAKAAGPLLIVLLTNKFDNPTDGVVYGTAVGLGFAVTENLYYAFGAISLRGGIDGILILVGGRTLLVAGIHALSSATFGGFLGYAVLSAKKAVRLGWVSVGLVLAIALHAAWNMAVQYVGLLSPAGSFRGWLMFIPALYVVYAVILAAFLRTEHRILKVELAEEVELMLAPAWIVDVIPYYRRRVRSDWWPSRVERTVIARLLTRVAFRKHALRGLPRDEANVASLELVMLRQRVREILGPPQSS
jgi:RsiW-degrading membrane proteinase PrsW (M82 family)